jgi:diaminohydroxyphosphoribosylaminopyrimidine deaminase / 5-amino-6-(5-phosphoribosylamino)uracil reductase
MHFYPVMTDMEWMQLAYAEALAVKGKTLPNPAVGALVVKQGQCLGRGGTQPAGQAHAEIMALREAGERARQAVLYVTLEPCCHFGRTPPCTDAIIAAGIKRVVVSAGDANPLVAGQGVARLREAGIEVTEGVLKEEGEAFYRHFAHFIQRGRPRIILKIAQSLDGRINAGKGQSTPLTGEAAQKVNHRLRVEADAWVIGGETLRRDNPQLTPRLVKGPAPEALVVSRGGRRILRTQGDGSLPRLFQQGQARKVRLIARSRPLHLPESIGFSALPGTGTKTLSPARLIRFLLADFQKQGYHLVVIEGGPSLWQPFLRQAAFDELWLFTAPRFCPKGESWNAGLPSQWDKSLVFRSFTALGEDSLTVFGRG